MGSSITNSSNWVGPGIDVRGEGGMVLAPPSTRKDGTYRWLNDLPIADAPLWLIELARKSNRSSTPAAGPDHVAGYNSGTGVETPSPEVAEAALNAIDPDCSEEVWRDCAAALKNVQGGFDIFDRWSAQSHKYPGTVECEKRFKHFCTLMDINFGTLIHICRRGRPEVA